MDFVDEFVYLSVYITASGITHLVLTFLNINFINSGFLQRVYGWIVTIGGDYMCYLVKHQYVWMSIIDLLCVQVCKCFLSRETDVKRWILARS